MAVTVEELEIIIRANVDDAIKKMDKFKQRLKSTLAAQLPQMKAQIEAVKPIVDQYGNTLQSALKKAETPMKQAAKQVQEATAKVEKAVTSTAKVQEAAAPKAAAAEKAKVDAAKRADKEYEAIFQRMKARQNDGGGHYQSTFVPSPSTPAKTATAISSKKEPTASNASPMAKTMDELRSKINAVKPQFEQMKQAAIAAFDNPAAERLKAQLDIINAKLQNQKAIYRQLLSQHESVSADKGEDSPQAMGIEKKIIGADEAIAKMVDRAREIEAALKRAVEPTEEIKTAAKSAEPPIKKVKKETDNATSATKKYERQVRKTGGVSVTIFQRIGRSIRGMLVSLLSYKAIGAIFRSLREGIQNMAQASGSVNNTMSRLSTSFLYAKNSIAAAFMPAIQALTPAITFLADKLAELFNIVGMVTARLFGNATMFTQAKKAQTDYAAGLGKMGDSAEKAGKKAQRSVLGFDQLNKLQAPEENTSSGGNGVAQPSQMFEQVKMPDNIIKFVDKLKVAFQPVSEALGRLKGQLDRLGQFAWAGLKDFWETFLKPLGKWTLGVGLPRFIDAISKGLAAIDWGKINNSLHGLWESLEPFAENVGEGLLWLWENVIIPFGTWVMNDVVPVFIDMLKNSIDRINTVIDIFKPAAIWLWDNFLKPIAQWTGGVIVGVLKWLNDVFVGITDWMRNNEGVVQGMTITVAAFFAAWKVTELLSFIQQSGGVIGALKRLGTAIGGVTIKKLKDKAETIALTAMYAKDFIVSLARTTKELVKQGAQWVALKIKKIAEAAASKIAAAGQALLNLVMNANPIVLIITAIAALVAAFIWLWENCEGFREFWLNLWDNIKNICASVAQWFEDTWNAIVQWFSDLWQSIADWAAGCWNSIVDAWNACGEWFDTNIIQPVKNFFEGLWNGISDGAKMRGNGLSMRGTTWEIGLTTTL